MLMKKLRSLLFPTKGKYADFMNFTRPVAGALIVAFTFRTFLYDPYRIPSSSMLPTLLVGDYLFVSRFAYGTHIPFTDITLWQKDPVQGDIVVFRKDIGQGRTNYIKRIVALPGDRVSYRDKTLYVNGKPQLVVIDEAAPKYNFEEAGYDQHTLKYFETLNNGVTHSILKDPVQPTYNLDNIVVPPDSYIAMGDNRDHSYDTRFWKYPEWSFVQRGDIIGRAEFLYWSWNDYFAPRWERLLNSLRVEAKAS